MNQKLKYGLFLLLFGGAAIVLFWPESSESKAPRKQESSIREPQKRDSSVERMKELIRSDYNTPIDFWGKVIDQDGNALAGAKAEIVLDEQATKKKYVTFSDDKGLFELLGKKGARARIKVFLDGYGPTSDEKIGPKISARTIYYSMEAMPAYAPPTKENPQVFVLRKRNPVANLAHALKKRVSINKTGDAQKIKLKTAGKTVEIEVHCWSASPVPFTYDRYDWRAEIQIINGKLLPYNSMNSFQAPQIEAPLHGYQQIFQVDMPKDTKENWSRSSPNGKKDFWIQFLDGTYAKASIRIKTGRKHEVDAEVWYNLDGTNNFEQ